MQLGSINNPNQNCDHPRPQSTPQINASQSAKIKAARWPLLSLSACSGMALTRLSAKNSPTTVFPCFFSQPSPFILSARHCPLKQLPSSHSQIPSPLLQSSQKCPRYESPFFQEQTPSPCFSPLLKSPQQDWPLVSLRIPFPCLKSSSQLPSYVSPFLYQQSPWLRWLSLNCPRKTSPLKRVSQPSTLLFLCQSPSKTEPSLKQQVPLPSLCPSSNLPLQQSLLTNSRVPDPWGWSLQNYPEQTLPSLNMILPLPSFLFALYSPTYDSPAILSIKWPFPSLQPFFHCPSQYSSSLQKTPYPFFQSASHSPSQAALPCSQKQDPCPSLAPS